MHAALSLEMHDLAGRIIPYFPAAASGSNAPIEVLPKPEDVVVERSDIRLHFATRQQAAPGYGGHLAGSVHRKVAQQVLTEALALRK